MQDKSGRNSIHPSGGVLGKFCGYTMRSRSLEPEVIVLPLLLLAVVDDDDDDDRSSNPNAASHAILYTSPAYRRNCVKVTLLESSASPVTLLEPPVLVRNTTLNFVDVTEIAASRMASLAIRAEAECGMVNMARVCLCRFCEVGDGVVAVVVVVVAAELVSSLFWEFDNLIIFVDFLTPLLWMLLLPR